MAGHSKWANIKHQKGRQDEKRQKVFSKLIREITVAARLGGSDAADNPRLRLALDRAFRSNMPKDTIERAVSRGAGDTESENLEEVLYEGYGPGGVAILVETMTDNRNRTVAEVRHAFSKAGGSLGTDGSVSYLFKKFGQIIAKDSDEDKLLELLISTGIEDLESLENGRTLINMEVENLSAVKQVLDSETIEIEESELVMNASVNVELDKDTSEKVIVLLENLDDLDDVQNVHSNAEFIDNL
ncbi:MAG: YebC/PmpR family DNA-binding transcriptional regulator [Gammaproteobacteria bacterium]|jgi:YebC/PmpR family DNA-binding regulatory protein|nr:MAG: YebC/PmpR family DNA-binding transcriptional regulator [Gammaproteobacteria bacterium]